MFGSVFCIINLKQIEINRIYNQSLIQTEKSQPFCQWTLPETQFPALSVYPQVGISRSASETDV